VSEEERKYSDSIAPTKGYNITMKFVIEANNAAEAMEKVEAMLFDGNFEHAVFINSKGKKQSKTLSITANPCAIEEHSIYIPLTNLRREADSADNKCFHQTTKYSDTPLCTCPTAWNDEQDDAEGYPGCGFVDNQKDCPHHRFANKID